MFTFKPDHLWVEHLLAGAAPAEKGWEGTLTETSAPITLSVQMYPERQNHVPTAVV